FYVRGCLIQLVLTSPSYILDIRVFIYLLNIYKNLDQLKIRIIFMLLILQVM
ncbi:hypothetical protein L9F63_010106, partial [Diploptera punctata]